MKKLLLFILTLTIFSSCGEKTTADKICDLANETLEIVKEYKDNMSEMPTDLKDKMEEIEDKAELLAEMWEKENPDLSENDLREMLLEECDGMKQLMDLM